jgi:PGF-pre-PGF domain-containing protein
MPKSRNLFKYSSYRRKPDEKIKPNNKKLWRIACARTCIVFTVCSLLLSLCGPVGADRFLPALSQDIVIEETCVSVSLTTPASTVFINITEYTAQQIVKNITVEFREPVAYVSFTIDVLSDKPPYEGIPRNETVLQYYAIRFSTDLADKITSVTMVFAVEKAAAQERDGEVTLVLYRYDGGKIEECPAEKVEEDYAFLYFKTETEGSSYIAVTRVLMPAPWWLAVAIIATIVLATVIGIYAYRRGKLANLTKLMETWHGK